MSALAKAASIPAAKLLLPILIRARTTGDLAAEDAPLGDNRIGDIAERLVIQARAMASIMAAMSDVSL